ncbi:hypothetical protein ACFE04_015651 [Oxalis oulophora]
MAYSSLLSVSLCVLLLFSSCYAQIEQFTARQHQQQRRGLERFQSQCQLQNLNVLHPNRKIKSEAGTTEIWDQSQEELQCAGVVVVRHKFEQRGLLLPSFNNAPQLMYIVQGRGIHGAAFPGCPETFQSTQQSQHQRPAERGQQSGDEHQKVREFREGDVIALPAGVSHWIYNNGQSQLVLVSLVDQSNYANQLDSNYRKFFLAGNPQEEVQGSQQDRESEREERREQRGNNIFSGLDERTLADAFNIDTQLAKKLQSQDDKRGIIVRAKEDFQVVRPGRQQEEEYEHEERRRESRDNGLEETFCTMRLKHNIADPKRADIYNPRAGRISTVNNYNLPILNSLRLSAEHGTLYRNGIYAPHWNINAHSIVYVTRGSGRCQIVDNNGNQVFNDRVQEGQLLVVPQNFAVVKQASSEGFEWIAFKTNENAKISPLAGRTSVTRAIPEEVLMNSFRISREEARKLKFNRQETSLLQSTKSQQEY